MCEDISNRKFCFSYQYLAACAVATINYCDNTEAALLGLERSPGCCIPPQRSLSPLLLFVSQLMWDMQDDIAWGETYFGTFRDEPRRKCYWH